MGYNNDTYTILLIIELNNIDYSQVMEDSSDAVKKNGAGTEFIVKWFGQMPASVAAIIPTPNTYTHEEILTEIAKSEWQPIT